MGPQKTNLIGMPRGALEAWFAQAGEKPFRARQLMKWMYRRGLDDFDAMTDLGRNLRGMLASRAAIRVPDVLSAQQSADGTRKWLLRMDAAQAIETVFIPEAGRGTLCISSQVGCALDCAFCATAQQGFNRNLASAEIVGQVLLARRMLGTAASGPAGVTNVVFMGMGEPLANYRQVLPALQLMLDELGFGLSRRRVTVSTSGLVPQMRRLADDCNVALAVSLHAPDDELRDRLVPINRRHPIAELLEACWYYASRHNSRVITFEYVMLDGVNDTRRHAQRLARLLRGRPAKVNLIPFNPFPGTRFQRSPAASIDRFREVLMMQDIMTITRRPRGEDIDAACGQLAGRVSDRTRVRLGTRLSRGVAHA
ncbi:MAG TPA: 23S rRNA (adenine(2503)-C(2))-methyltransferase RlmN [Gammaproteobacteria bacterium]|nr:23S rRNA (adenine(2503)-C(2))-methyltransferase RlmN [Gammaproteobacteria bacterium]